jgi:hypothetical protein
LKASFILPSAIADEIYYASYQNGKPLGRIDYKYIGAFTSRASATLKAAVAEGFTIETEK